MKKKKTGRLLLSFLLLTVIAWGTPQTPARAETAELETQENPVYHEETDTTDWTYVPFGSYPKTELAEGEITEAVINAAYNENGDAWISGSRYRRIPVSDTDSYRYFKWQPILWRVLEKEKNYLTLVADEGVDARAYHDTASSVSWKESALRLWLGSEFYSQAFSGNEQAAMKMMTVEDEADPFAVVKDRVRLLSLSEAANQSYGFCPDYEKSKSRCFRVGDYAAAMGANSAESADFWLRSSGKGGNYAAVVLSEGQISPNGKRCSTDNIAVVPVICINTDVTVFPEIGGPYDVDVLAGRSAEFFLNLSGGNLSGCTFQWYYSSDFYGRGEKIKGAETSYCTIPSASFYNEGFYYCVVGIGQEKIESDRALLTIHESAVVEISDNQSVKPGRSASFWVAVDGEDISKCTYQWYYTASVGGSASLLEGEVSPDYQIQEVLAEDEGYYYCVVQVETSSISYTASSGLAKLTVYKPPELTGPYDQNVTVGKRAEFSVLASGGNSFDYAYQWYYAVSRTAEGREIPGEEGAEYAIERVEMDDAGYYYCVVSTDQFDIKSNVARLLVSSGGSSGGNSDKPGSSSDKKEKLKAPSPLVQLISSNAVKLTWKKISGATGYHVYRTDSPKGKYSKIKTVKGTAFSDSKLKSGRTYYYKVAACKGKTVGKESKAVSKKIAGKLPAPTLKMRIEQVEETFTLSWNRLANADKVEIYRKVDETGTYKKWKTISAKKTELVSSYQRFTIGHTYFFKIRMYYARDKISVYSGYSKGYGIRL